MEIAEMSITTIIRSALVTGLFLLIAMATPLIARAQFLHPKITTKEATIRNVVIMPAKVDVVRDSMKGPEGMAAESEELSARVERLVAEALVVKNVKATSAGTTPPADGDAEQKYTVADIQARYDDLLPKIAKKRSDVKKGRFTMGDEVLTLNVDKSTDALVFIRGQGQKLTGGKKAFVALVGGAPAYLRLTISIVDARTGDVLVYTDPIYVGDPTTAKDQTLRKPIDKSLKKLPG
jgi:hypothetical protein